MSLDDLVTINISAATVTPSKPGFGTILIAAQKVPAGFTMRSRLFASLSEMTDFGFSVSDPAYLCAQRMKAQNPSIPNWKVGKRANKCTQTTHLQCTSTTVGDHYAVTVAATDIAYTVASGASAVSVTFAEVGATGDTITRGTGSFVTDGFKPGMLLTSAGTSTNNFSGALIATVSATVLTLDTQDLTAEVVAATLTAVHTASSIATYLATLIDAISGVNASTSTDTIIVTSSVGTGELVDVKGWSTNMVFSDVTADPGLAADLAAIQAFDKNWYGLALDSNSKAETEIAAVFVEANKKLFVSSSSDFGCEDSGSTTDVMSELKSSSYARTGVLYSRSQLLSYSGAAWMAKQFTQTPGSDTWKFKTLAGVTTDTISDAARATVLGKNGNTYTDTSGVSITENGMSASGEFLDITRFVDWLRAEIQFRVFSALVNNGKIAYTDAGVDLVGSIIKGALQSGVDAGGLEKGTISVSFPLVANIDPANRATRALSGGRFAGRLAGAIHSLTIDGTLTA